MEKAERFRKSIKQKISSVISKSCSCEFPLSLIEDGVFSCRSFNNYVAYRSKLKGLLASHLLQYLFEGIKMDPSLKVDWLLLDIHSQCSMRIGSISDPDCIMPSSNFTQDDVGC